MGLTLMSPLSIPDQFPCRPAIEIDEVQILQEQRLGGSITSRFGGMGSKQKAVPERAILDTIAAEPSGSLSSYSNILPS